MQASFKSGTDDTLPRRSASRFALAPRLFNAHRLNFRLLEEDAAAMSLEGGEADDLQIRVDLQAVIYDLQRFAEQRKLFTLLPPAPCGITLTDSCLMLPIKSISGVMAVGSCVEKRPYGCAICGRKDCYKNRLRKAEKR